MFQQVEQIDNHGDKNETSLLFGIRVLPLPSSGVMHVFWMAEKLQQVICCDTGD